MDTNRTILASAVAMGLLIAGSGSPARAIDKWHPGIYMGDGAGGPGKPLPAIYRIEGNPNYIGVRRVYNWKDLEPADGQYDFSFVLSDYQAIVDAGLYLAVHVRGSSYFGGHSNVPEWLRNDPIYGGSTPGEYGICHCYTDEDYTFPAIWRPAVRERIMALTTELAAVFDDLPNFAYVNVVGESSTGARGCEGFSCEEERLAYLSLASHSRSVFVHTPSFAGPNFACYDIPNQVVPTLVEECIGFGPPNIKPNNSLLSDNIYQPMLLFHDAAPTYVYLDAYNDLGTLTPADLFDFTESSIKPHFLIVTLTNSANRAQIMADLDEWMNELGGVWPWQQPPECIDEAPMSCAEAGGVCCVPGDTCEGGSFVDSADCGELCCQAGACGGSKEEDGSDGDSAVDAGIVGDNAEEKLVEGCGCGSAPGPLAGPALLFLLLAAPSCLPLAVWRRRSWRKSISVSEGRNRGRWQLT